MKDVVVEIGENEPPLNAISLKNAVLCADCDVVSDSPHDRCRVCGSRSLFNISRILGGMLPRERAMVVTTAKPLQPVLTFPRPQRIRETHPRRFKSG
jgi:hypothetical protein